MDTELEVGRVSCFCSLLVPQLSQLFSVYISAVSYEGQQIESDLAGGIPLYALLYKRLHLADPVLLL